MATRVTKALSQLFDQGAASYAQYRPEYPPELYRTILQHAKLASRKTAVDIATGSGQAAKDLAQYFDSVIALDSSEAQLKHAPELAKVTFQQGQAEDTKLDSASVDLLTVAQALHWWVSAA